MKQTLEYAAINCKEQMAKENPGASWDCTDVLNAFKAGARWMTKQGYSEETYVYANRFNDEYEAVIQLGQGELERGGFKPGDKVTVQIRKAE